jgi:hypothetical protein
VGEHLFQLAAVLLANLGCAILGGVIGSAQTRRALRAAVPARVGYHPDGPGEETVEVRTAHAESTAVAAELVAEPEPESTTVSLPPDFATGWWAVSKTQRLNPLEDETVRVVIAGVRPEGARRIEAPYAWLTRNGNPDEERSRLTRQTAELPQVPSGEYPVLDGVSG